MSFAIDPLIPVRFDEFKIRHKFKWVMFGVDGDRHVCKESETGKTKTVEDLVKALPDSDCRYVVFEHVYKTVDGRSSDRLYFISWLPRSSSNPQKMLYTTARPFIRAACPGCIDITATTRGEVLDQIHRADGKQKDDDEASDEGGGDWMDD